MDSGSMAGGSVGDPVLGGQTVVIIGGSAGIGRATAQLATARGAQVVLTGRDPDRLAHAAKSVGAHAHSAFDAHVPPLV